MSLFDFPRVMDAIVRRIHKEEPMNRVYTVSVTHCNSVVEIQSHTKPHEGFQAYTDAVATAVSDQAPDDTHIRMVTLITREDGVVTRHIDSGIIECVHQGSEA